MLISLSRAPNATCVSAISAIAEIPFFIRRSAILASDLASQLGAFSDISGIINRASVARAIGANNCCSIIEMQAGNCAPRSDNGSALLGPNFIADGGES